jgi:hypothetical protein
MKRKLYEGDVDAELEEEKIIVGLTDNTTLVKARSGINIIQNPGDMSKKVGYVVRTRDLYDAEFKVCMSHLQYLIENIEMLKPYLESANKIYENEFRREPRVIEVIKDIGVQFVEQSVRITYMNRLMDEMTTVFISELEAFVGAEYYNEFRHAFGYLSAIPNDDTRRQAYDELITVDMYERFPDNFYRINIAMHELRLAYGGITKNNIITPSLLYIAHLHMIPWRNVLLFYQDTSNPDGIINITEHALFIVDKMVSNFLVRMGEYLLAGKPPSLFKLTLLYIIQNKIGIGSVSDENIRQLLENIQKASIFHLEDAIKDINYD